MPQVNFGKASMSLKIDEDTLTKLKDLKLKMKSPSYSHVIRKCIRNEYANLFSSHYPDVDTMQLK